MHRRDSFAASLVCLPILVGPIAASAVVVVDHTGDLPLVSSDCATPGLCTLRQAVEDSNAAGNETIELTQGSTYQLSLGDLVIDPGASNTVAIVVAGAVGASALDTAIDGGASDRVFTVTSGTLDVSGVAIRNGNPGNQDGGGILVQAAGTLLLSDAIVTGNAGDDGGGLAVQSGGVATLTRVHVSGNRVTRAPSGDGGGIHNAGTLALVTATVSGNHGVIDQGGGIFNLNPGTVVADDSSIIGHGVIAQGGGLWSNSAGELVEQDPEPNPECFPEAPATPPAVCVTNTALSANTSEVTGGGLYLQSGELRIVQSDVFANAADDGAADPEGDGGGLYMLAGRTDVVQSRFAGNHAGFVATPAQTNGGFGGAMFAEGGALVVDESTLEDNRSGQRAAGIWVEGAGALELTRSTVVDNVAGGSAGGIHLQGTGSHLIEDTTITDNQAGFHFSNSDGGGLWTQASFATLSRSTVSGNTTPNAADAYGGGVFVFGNTLDIFDSTISGNAGGRGGGIGSNGSAGALNLTNVTLVFNAQTQTLNGENLFHATASYPTSIKNSIVARDPGPPSSANNGGSCGSGTGATGLVLAFPGSDYNLRENGDTCGFNSGNDRTFQAADLGPLQDNGGEVETHALLQGDGIDAANDSLCTDWDNRAFERSLAVPMVGPVVDCDMGSYEVEALPEAGVPAGLLAGVVMIACLRRARRSEHTGREV